MLAALLSRLQTSLAGAPGTVRGREDLQHIFSLSCNKIAKIFGLQSSPRATNLQLQETAGVFVEVMPYAGEGHSQCRCCIVDLHACLSTCLLFASGFASPSRIGMNFKFKAQVFNRSATFRGSRFELTRPIQTIVKVAFGSCLGLAVAPANFCRLARGLPDKVVSILPSSPEA